MLNTASKNCMCVSSKTVYLQKLDAGAISWFPLIVIPVFVLHVAATVTSLHETKNMRVCVVATMLWHPPFLRSHRHWNFYLLPAGLSRSLHRQKQNVLIISWHQSLHKNKGTHFAIVTKWGLYLGIRLTYQELWWHHASSAKCWHDQAWHPRPHGCVQPSRIPVQSTETSISM